jgi:AraC family transcriptional regulator
VQHAPLLPSVPRRDRATFADYAAARRVARARALLASARPPIKEIAWRCGFDTAAAFSAAFRRDVGVTPSEYRRALIH